MLEGAIDDASRGHSPRQELVPVQGLCPPDLERLVPGISAEEARRVVSQTHRGEDLATPSSGIRRTTRERVLETVYAPTLRVVEEQASQVDPFVKYVLETADGHLVETVRIPLEREGRYSVCVSSQVGCALACSFCATGRIGLHRNLEAWEIVEQVRMVKHRLPRGARVHGVVFQGMGEPMANLDRVLAAVRVMSDPSALAIDARGITVCTSGLPTGIRRLAREAPNVRLGLSLGSAIRETRARLMPIERSFGLDEVLDAACEHAELTTLSPMIAVTLLAGVNDDQEHAEALAALVRDFRCRTGRSPRLSVIPYNAIGGADPFTRTSEDREASFRDWLRDAGVFSHKRYSGGGDVRAACGQLAAHSRVKRRRLRVVDE